MTSSTSLYGRFHDVARARPDAIALSHPQLQLTYRQLLGSVDGFAASLAEHGVATGTTVALVSIALTTNINMVLALSCLGASGVLAGAGKSPDAPRSDLTVGAREGGRDLRDGTVEIRTGWLGAKLSPEHAARSSEIRPGAGLSSLRVESIGAGQWEHTAETELLRRIALYAEGGPTDLRWATTLVPWSYEFMLRALACLLAGGTIVTTEDRDFFNVSRVTRLSGSVRSLQTTFSQGARLPAMEQIDCVEPVLTERTVRSLLESAPMLRQVFDLSGTGPSYRTDFRLEGGIVVASGTALDATLEIAEDGGLRIKATGAAEWSAPGLVARWGDNSALFVSAAPPNVVMINDHTVDLQVLDAEVAAIEGISDAVLFKNPKPGAEDELFAFVVIEEGYNLGQLKALARSHCRQKGGAWAAPRVVQPIARVPRLPNGLPDRTACNALILELAASRDAP